MRRLPPLALLTLAACGSDSTPPLAAGSFARIQNEVLTPRCAVSGCHVGASVATSGGLNLSGNAYDALVGAQPGQFNARQDGLRRVLPFKTDSSLLYLKLVSPPLQRPHDYGNTMPVGGTPISVGQLEYLVKWIAAGAPRSGEVADSALLRDATPQNTAAFEPLPPPPAGQGIQLHADAFTVAQGFERELFVLRPLANNEDIYIKRIEFRMRPNSHHFVLYTFDSTPPPLFQPQPNVVRDIRNPDGTMNFANMVPMAYHVFFGGSMQPSFAYDFPPGVALRMPAGAALDMNVHYVNRTAGTLAGEAFANLYTTNLASVQHVAKTLNLSNTSIVLPAGKRTTLEKTFLMAQTTTVFGLSSHMHMMGERFEIRIVGGARDGETVYVSTDWEHPPMAILDKPIVLQKGEGLKSVITWNNTMNHTVQFGLLSTDEMGIVFGYYY